MMTIEFDKRLAELDAYLQMLIEQAETLDKKLELASSDIEKDGLSLIKNNLDSLLGSIKHSIVLLQIAKVSIRTNPPQSTLSSSSAMPQWEPQLTHPTPPRPPQRQRQQRYSSSPASAISTAAIVASPREQHHQQYDRNCSYDDKYGVTNENENETHKSVLVNAIATASSSSSANYKADAANYDDDDDDDDDAFYDAADEHHHHSHTNTPRGVPQSLINMYRDPAVATTISQTNNSAPSSLPASHLPDQSSNSLSETDSLGALPTSITMPNQINFSSSCSSGDDGASIDWDALYDEEEEDLGSLENQGSVIKHLISQIRIGMDLTKVVLPTFILERRSLLEMYADFFAHPDLFSSIPDYDTPEERMVQLVKWYLSAFHVGRKSSVAKKPYNPILGEIFLCHWSLNAEDNDNNREANGSNCKTETTASKSQQKTELNNELGVSIDENSNNSLQNFDRTNSTESTCSVGDIEKFSKQLPHNSLLFVAEQVSHHPPVSAFYAENPAKAISCCSHIYTKSKYLGLSVGVHNIGEGVVSLLKHNEDYVCTFPSAYGRSILTVPWVELGGSVNITCRQSGYSARIEFVTKPFYGGRKHRVIGGILRPDEKPFMTIDGEWNGVMYSKCPQDSSDKQVFVDTTCLPVIKKHVRSISSQESFESRNVWKEVTRALKLRDVASATAAKSFIEQKQRDLLKDRMEKGFKWRTRYFEAVDDGWTYAKPLAERMSTTHRKSNTNKC